jgi:SHOCT-like protein
MNSNNDETRRILDLLSQGKITVDEAQQLLSALEEPAAGASAALASESPSDAEKPAPRFLRITVTEAPNDFKPKGKTVNIRVPMSLIRGGIRLGALVPGLGEHWHKSHFGGGHVDFSKLSPAELERTLRDLDDLSIDVDQGKKQVQFHCE